MSNCTIIIVNWNSWEYLFPCLESLGRQTFQDFDIIVVDNNSTDQVPGEQLAAYPYVSYIQNKDNVGFAAANNQAIEIANNCEWIVLLNPDTLPAEKWLESLHNASLAHPEFSFFGSRLLLAGSPDILDGTGDVYHMSGLSWRTGHGKSVSTATDRPEEIFSPCAAAAMYRRKDILAVGGFDEDFFCYNEDVDLGFRLQLAGHRALSVPDSVVLHHGSATTSVRSDFSVYHGHRNLVWTWFKDMPMLLLVLLLPVHIAYNAASVLLYMLRGQGRIICQAKWDAVKGLKRMWQKRAAIHNKSAISISSLWNKIDRRVLVGPKTKH